MVPHIIHASRGHCREDFMPAATPCLWKNRYISKSNGSVQVYLHGRLIGKRNGADRPALGR